MSNMVWDLFVELRRELLEAQKIRAQVIGFKITFVSAIIGLLAANYEDFDKALFVIPAFASIFFDFIIYSYSFSIKRIGSYTRECIEPVLKQNPDIPDNFRMWQEYLTQPKTKQNLAVYGNIGVTLLAVGTALLALLFPYRLLESSVLIFVLAFFLVMDILAYREHRKLGKIWVDKDFEQPICGAANKAN